MDSDHNSGFNDKTQLEIFCDEMRDKIDEFEQDWLKNNAKNPKQYPLNLDSFELFIYLEHLLDFLEN